MRLPESWTDRFPFLAALEDDWEPVSKWAMIAWLAFYALFLWQLARGSGFLLMLDLVLIPVHEGGHLLFAWFGRTLSVMGGTFLQLFVPFALAVYFFFRRQVPGTVFSAFIFFEQLLPIATYMADARRQELPLLTVGNAESVEHDWYVLFSQFGVLEHDVQIAGVVRALGWLGMLGTVAWLLWRSRAGMRTTLVSD